MKSNSVEEVVEAVEVLVDTQEVETNENHENMPERTCIVCREKNEKSNLFRIAKRGSKFIFDREQRMQTRGSYICKTHECVKRLSKHKKYNVEISELSKMLEELKKGAKDYLGALNAMKTSDFLSFGMNMVFEDIARVHFIIIAEDISEKNDKKIISKAKEMGIKYVHSSDKNQLGEIFGKTEVTVVGVKNKKVARGLAE